MKNKRKICVVLVDRANYGRLKPVMAAIKNHPSLELSVIASGTLVLERFSYPIKEVERDGFEINSKIYVELEGSVPTTMAKSIGFSVIEFSSEFLRLEPDIVLLIGDRYEALAACIAASYMNKTVCHIQGGEVSGSIDESARHAITKFSHYHFPSTHRSKEFLVRMGENPETILGVGCPSSDIAKSLIKSQKNLNVLNFSGNGPSIDVNKPFLLSIYHPNTTKYGSEVNEMLELLKALDKIKMQTVILWPNIDAGSDHISKTLRVFRDNINNDWLRTITNVNPTDYLNILANAACAVGNSSSFVRDSSFLGTPVVLVGDRQDGREFANNVIKVKPVVGDIERSIQFQLNHGPYDISSLYGDGNVSDRIASELAKAKLYSQKILNYIYEA